MADDFKDPRDVPWHPRRAVTLLGHGAAEGRLLQAHQSGKLHHAWLISGNRGIGKATLAYRFAKFLLHVPLASKARAHNSLHVPAEVPSARLVAAASHPDLLVIERAVDQRNKRLKAEIAVDDARKAQNFFARTSGTGGWRIAIVDCADELNGESANALLKVIEEPPEKSIFLLVCHQPGRLLRTIRSRCIHLELSPLDMEATLRVLHGLPSEAVAADEQPLREAAELSRGSPGRAMEMLGSRGAAAFAEFLKRPKLTPAACIEIGANFTGRETAEDYGIFCELLIGWIAAKARDAGLSGRGEVLALAHDDINTSLRQTDALNLDRRQTVADALLRLEEALKAS
jgi:DNA polymerase III subunit delta'